MSEKALLLLSGGIDSPVAAHRLQKSGLEVSALHFSLEPYADSAPEKKSIEVAKKLGISPVYRAALGPAMVQIAQKCPHRDYYVLTKRFMLRVAERHANKEGIPYVATGDNLAQVSSQTLENMTVIDQAVRMRVLRPLLCFDKVEIIAMAQGVGTFDISSGPEHCDALGPARPATRTTVPRIEEEEGLIEYASLLDQAEKSVERIL